MKPFNLGPVTRALSTMRTRFEAVGHKPSAAQWEALEDLVRCLDSMAMGTAKQTVYLSSLDPGLGKTTALKCYLHQLLAQHLPPYSEVGCLICLNTLDEVERLIDDVGIPEDMLGIWTSRSDLNVRGRADLQNAQVLITTHSRVLKETRRSEFWLTESLYFKGQPRQLRVWDEEFLPGTPISLSVNDVMATLKRVQSASGELRNRIKAAFDEIDGLPDGSVYTVPDYMGDTSTSLKELLKTIAPLRGRSPIADEMEASMEALSIISGRRVVVRRDNPEGNACVDYVDTIPPDLAPIVVLDASGRRGVRVLYEDMEDKRGMITPLKSAPKSYRNLTIHVWRRGGGKSSWATPDGAPQMLDGIASTICRKPQEEWLIVHHKPDQVRGIPDMDTALHRRLSLTTYNRVSFRNWGAHKATNAYAHISNVVLAGTLFYRTSQYEARKRLGAALTADHPNIPEKQMKEFMVGESANDVLQAACRGSIRRSLGDTCPPSNLYLIADPRKGIEKALPRIFPGAKIIPWLPVKLDLKGNSEKAFKIVLRWKKTAKPGDVLTFKELAACLDISLRQLKDTVRRNTKFMRSIEAEGLNEWGSNKYSIGYRLEDPLV
ncbi:hypothetical protein [Hyphomicrobium sp. ghe19]|uniref:hypothetical protein n=1 Tax=Hyphomicrobium sp. ghe19 TaxID=2682968 RepID=UPI0013677C65|nr:hypothetical protein HYPP_02994 [Hyphomicrobium sp. ghe19]